MVSRSRWRRAQRYERDYWRTFADRIVQGSVSQLDWYAWRAGQLAAKLDGLGLGHLTGGEARVIEIGSGPIGLLAYFEAADRVSDCRRGLGDIPVAVRDQEKAAEQCGGCEIGSHEDIGPISICPELVNVNGQHIFRLTEPVNDLFGDYVSQ